MQGERDKENAPGISEEVTDFGLGVIEKATAVESGIAD
jgi:hypothetical protein